MEIDLLSEFNGNLLRLYTLSRKVVILGIVDKSGEIS